MKKDFFDITGMTCSACANRIEKGVKKLPGIQEVSVNLLKNSMMVSYDETALNRDDIIQSVEKAGYGASVKEETQKSQVSSNTGAEKKDAAKEQYKLMK